MARRTYRRPVSYNELSNKQLNSLAGQDQYMAQFSGLNTGKNYTTIDQNSFAKVNNMYVDMDERLSTRPPMKTSQDSKYSSLHIISYKSINGVHFFVVNDGGTKLVSDLGYSNSLITLGNISTSGRLFFVNGKYMVFDTDAIWGFSIDYTNKSYTKYTEEDLIYVPTSYDLNPRNDKEVAKNIFTPNVIEEMIYTYSHITGEANLPDDGTFIGKEVIVTMNGEDYKIIWTSNRWRTFVYKLYEDTTPSNILDKVTNIEFSRDGKNAIAYNCNNDNGKTFKDGFYYSYNGGKSFRQVPNPFNDTEYGCALSLSEDNIGLLYVGYDVSDDNPKLKIAFAEFPLPGDDFNWEVYDYDFSEFQKINANNTQIGSERITREYCYSTQFYSTTTHSNIPERNSMSKNMIAHCVDRHNFVICVKPQYWETTTGFTDDPMGETSDVRDEDMTSSAVIPIIVYSYVKDTKHMVLHFANPVGYEICDVTLIPTKNRVRMITDDDGNAVIMFSYFAYGSLEAGTLTDELHSEIVRAFVSYNRGFAPGIFKAAYVENLESGVYYRPYGVVTSLGMGVSEYPNIPEKEIFNNKWMDFIGTVYYNEEEQSYDYDYLMFVRKFPRVAGNISRVYNDKNDDYATNHMNLTDLSMEGYDRYKRRRPYYKFTPLSTVIHTSKYENSRAYLGNKDAAISYGMTLTSGSLESTPEGVLKSYNSIELFHTSLKDMEPLFIDDYGNFIYRYGNILYENGIEYDEEVIVKIDSAVSYNYLIPDFVNEIVTNNFTFIFKDSIYQSYYGDSKLYVPEYTKDTLEGEITNVIRFSDISLGIFLENSVYEYTYSSDITSQTEIPSFTRHPTKLQLGCLKGSDIVHTYDGASIIMTTKKGVAILNYQQFVQSTEQVYTFLSNNIDDYYEEWSGKYTKPIKITLFKDYIIFYQIDNPVILVFDTRNRSWWPWKLTDNFKIMADINNDLCLVSKDTNIIGLKFFDINDKVSYKDYDGDNIKWNFETQPLHFQAPNHYKHVSRVSIVNTDTPNKIAFNLKFVIYHNLNNMSESDIVFNKMEMLNTVIERINFVKLNAIKLICESNDEYTKDQFITSAIIIHYRPTEVIR